MLRPRTLQSTLGLMALSILWPLVPVWGASPPSDCQPTQNGSQLCQVPAKVGPDKRPFFYEIRRATGNASTVIAIPGGPGQGLIGSLKSVVQSDHIPDDLGVILIDPRGYGKNDFGTDPEGAIYSSVNLAKDIAAVIRAENLQNYFVHGQSYGTVLATILGQQIEELGLPRPKAIVLSGVAERVFKNPLKGYNDQIQRLIGMYTPDEQVQIRANLKHIQSQFRDHHRVFALLWISALSMNSEDPSSDGVSSINMRTFLDSLRDQDWAGKNQTLQFFLETAKGLTGTTSPINKTRRNDMPEAIKCRELTQNDGMWDVHFDIESMGLRTEILDCQEKGYRLTSPYHSEEHQILKTPLIYIQGRLDPATPWEGALLHFRNQQTRQKTFVLLNFEAHTGLSGLWRCRNQLWDHLGMGPASFTKFVNSCNANFSTIISN